MSFLDDLIDKRYGHEIQCSEMTRRRLDYMIQNALIYNRLEYEMRSAICSEDQALEMIAELSNQMPIMGLHSVPMDQRQVMESTKYLIDKDNLHENRWQRKSFIRET